MRRWVVGALVAGIVVAHASSPALAQSCLSSPKGALDADLTTIHTVANGWVTAGRNLAIQLGFGLLLIDFIYIILRTTLFGKDVSSLVGPVSMRFFTAVLFQFCVIYSDQVFEVVTSFTQSAQYLGGGTGVVDTIGRTDLSSACFLGGIAGAMHAGDANATNAIDTVLFPIPPILLPNGPILTGSAVASAHLHDTQIAVTLFLALVLLGCAAAVYLTYFVLFAENYIVMLGGILMLGFSGAALTQGFASSYLRYAVSCGSRLFFFYLILAIEQTAIVQTLAHVTAVTGLLFASAFGPQSVVLIDGELVASAVSILQLVIMTSLVMFVPQIAGAALFGNSSLGAGDFLRSVGASVAQAQGAASVLTSALKNTKAPE